MNFLLLCSASAFELAWFISVGCSIICCSYCFFCSLLFPLHIFTIVWFILCVCVCVYRYIVHSVANVEPMSDFKCDLLHFLSSKLVSHYHKNNFSFALSSVAVSNERYNRTMHRYDIQFMCVCECVREIPSNIVNIISHIYSHSKTYVHAYISTGMLLCGEWLSEYSLIKVIVEWCLWITIFACWNGNSSYFLNEYRALCATLTAHAFELGRCVPIVELIKHQHQQKHVAICWIFFSHT